MTRPLPLLYMYAVLRHAQLVTLNARRDEKCIHPSPVHWARFVFCPLSRHTEIRPLEAFILFFNFANASGLANPSVVLGTPKYRGIDNGRANDEEEGQGG